MTTHIERTQVAQQDFNVKTGEIPITVSDRPTDMFPARNGAAMDPFADDTPIEAVCDLENPDVCESCQ